MLKPIDVGHLMVAGLPGAALIGAQHPAAARMFATVSGKDFEKLVPGVFGSRIARAGEAVSRLPRLLLVPRLPMPALELAKHMPAIMAGPLATSKAPWLPAKPRQEDQADSSPAAALQVTTSAASPYSGAKLFRLEASSSKAPPH